MFNRREIKTRAKQIMNKYYLRMLLVSFILSLGSYGFIYSQVRVYVGIKIAVFIWGTTLALAANMLPIILLIGIVTLLIQIGVGYSLRYGCQNYFKHLSNDETNLDLIISGFKREKFKHIISTQMLVDIKIFLYSLLFIIPGIIKSFAYLFVPYILEDEPDLSCSEVLSRSQAMTQGIKFDIFILGLSFYWWNLLAAFLNIVTFGLASYLITPYPNQTYAELYLTIKEARAEEVTIEKY